MIVEQNHTHSSSRCRVNKAGHLGHFIRGTARGIGKARGVDIEEWQRGGLVQEGSSTDGVDGIESVMPSCRSG